MIKKIITASLFIVFANGAFAESATGNLQVKSDINATCIVKATKLNFGSINIMNGNTVSGNIKFTCSKGTSINLVVGSGSGSVTQRTMLGVIDSNEKLNYNIYLNNSDTILGDGTNDTFKLSSIQSGVESTMFISGKVPAGQYVKSDNYSDSVTVTISY